MSTQPQVTSRIKDRDLLTIIDNSGKKFLCSRGSTIDNIVSRQPSSHGRRYVWSHWATTPTGAAFPTDLDDIQRSEIVQVIRETWNDTLRETETQLDNLLTKRDLLRDQQRALSNQLAPPTDQSALGRNGYFSRHTATGFPMVQDWVDAKTVPQQWIDYVSHIIEHELSSTWDLANLRKEREKLKKNLAATLDWAIVRVRVETTTNITKI